MRFEASKYFGSHFSNTKKRMRHPPLVYLWKDAFQFDESKFSECHGGPVAQWITRLTTDQKIPGSNPGKVDFFEEDGNIFC